MAVALGGGWHTRERENRVVGVAALASLVLHALLLASFPGFLDRKKPSPIPERLVARLVAPKPEPAPPAPRAEEPPTPQPPSPPRQAETPPRPQAKPAAKAAPAPKPESAPAPVQQAAPSPAPSATVAQPAQPAADPAPGAPAAPAVQARVEPQPAAPVPSPDEAGLIAKFRLDVIAQARRFKRYPRLAMDNNWEGRADVRIVFGADGKRVSMSIVRSSGHEALDKQALDTLGKTFVPVPAALRGKEFAVEIPVIYSLKDENA